MIHLLGISGSLRAASINTALLRAAGSVLPDDATLEMYDGLAGLPHFSPDLDDDPPTTVVELRDRVQRADAVLIITPEYAAGMPGSLKNGLDWLVSSGEFVGKPVAPMSASPTPTGGIEAHRSLVRTLTMMSAEIVPGASLSVILSRRMRSPDGSMTDADTLRALTHAVAALVNAARRPDPAA